MHVAHRITLEAAGEEPLRFETDRRAFIGRGRTLANPAGSIEEPHNTEGYVLDPIFSVRVSVSLAPGQHVVAFPRARRRGRTGSTPWGSCASTPTLMPSIAPWTSRGQPRNSSCASCASSPTMPAASSSLQAISCTPTGCCAPRRRPIEDNVKGQAGLWQYGISGDLPIALVTINEIRDVGLVGQMLQAHAYWRMHGLMADLLIIAEEASTYERPMHERLEALIQAHSTHTGQGQARAVFSCEAPTRSRRRT